jgi:hypothetical protein
MERNGALWLLGCCDFLPLPVELSLDEILKECWTEGCSESSCPAITK